jgi:hypothetical protein
MRGKDDEVVLKEKTKRLGRIMSFWMVPSPGLRLPPLGDSTGFVFVHC